MLRTLSKAYGLAGARCGSVIADPEVIALLRKVIPPYAIAQPTIEAVLAALDSASAGAARERAWRSCAPSGTDLRAGARAHPRGAARVAERCEFPAGGVP